MASCTLLQSGRNVVTDIRSQDSTSKVLVQSDKMWVQCENSTHPVLVKGEARPAEQFRQVRPRLVCADYDGSASNFARGGRIIYHVLILRACLGAKGRSSSMVLTASKAGTLQKESIPQPRALATA